MCCRRLTVPFALASLLCFPAFAQLVISVHSGVLHFMEGSVFLNDQPLEQKLGTFPTVQEGSTLRTEEGRAEILLTPGVFLRLDRNSSLRMISNGVQNTRVEFLRGSAIIDSTESTIDAPAVAIVYKDTQIRFPKKGVYRLDSDPPVLQAYSGKAEVTREGKPSSVDDSHLFFFSLGLETQKIGSGADDQFYQWSKDRGDFISADNRSAAESARDPGEADPGQSNPGDWDIGAGAGRDPNLYLGSPSYGSPGSGAIGGLNPGLNPWDNGLLYSNVPFGLGVWNTYSVIFVYLPRYRHWPVSTPRLVGTHVPALPPAGVGLYHSIVPRYPTLPQRTVPGRTVGAGYSRPAVVSPSHVGATRIGVPAAHR